MFLRKQKSVEPSRDRLSRGSTLTLFHLSLDFISIYHSDLINRYINYVKDSKKHLVYAKKLLLSFHFFLSSHDHL